MVVFWRSERQGFANPPEVFDLTRCPGVQRQQRAVVWGAHQAGLVEHRAFNAQYLVEFGAGGGVLQKHFFIWRNDGHGAKGGQRTLMEATQDQLFLPG